MAVSGEFLAFVLDQLAALTPKGGIEAKQMMGGRTLYADGVIFGLIDDDQLYFKVNEKTRGRFESAGSHAFAPFKDQPKRTMNYWSAPEECLDDREALLAWARLGLEASEKGSTRRAGSKKVRKNAGSTKTKQSKKKESKKKQSKTKPTGKKHSKQQG
jgi:DNA transformation protein and related proteins